MGYWKKKKGRGYTLVTYTYKQNGLVSPKGYPSYSRMGYPKRTNFNGSARQLKEYAYNSSKNNPSVYVEYKPRNINAVVRRYPNGTKTKTYIKRNRY